MTTPDQDLVADLRDYVAKLRKALENTELRTHSELRQAPIKGVAAALALPVPGDERKTQSNGLR